MIERTRLSMVYWTMIFINGPSKSHLHFELFKTMIDYPKLA